MAQEACYGCTRVELNVCKWLHGHGGAAEDITKVLSDTGDTPMLLACYNGHLSVCEWLYKVGADKDISRADNCGDTPMLLACKNGHLSVCEWLVLNGALNRPTSSTAATEDEGDNDQAGHIDSAIVQRDTYTYVTDHRPALLKWAKRVVNTHHTFLHVVLRGSVVMPRHRTSPRRRCHLPLLPRDELERVGSFVGVETGRRLRNAREFAEALAVLPVE